MVTVSSFARKVNDYIREIQKAQLRSYSRQSFVDVICTFESKFSRGSRLENPSTPVLSIEIRAQSTRLITKP
jgi:hypothetical protein